MSSDFDVSRTQVAKDCVAAYLNFRFTTQNFVQRIRHYIGTVNVNNHGISVMPLYTTISPDIDQTATVEEITESYLTRKREIQLVLDVLLTRKETPQQALEIVQQQEYLQELEDAFSMLGDPVKKKSYDEMGKLSINEEDLSKQWGKEVHRFAVEIAKAWDRNDPKGVSLRLLYVLKDIADGSVNYVIISFILMLYLSGLGAIIAIAPNMFIQVLIGILQWLGIASSLIEHLSNIGTTLANITVNGSDIVSKTIKKDFGNVIADKIITQCPELVDYMDSVLVTLKGYTREQIEEVNVVEFTECVKKTFNNDKMTMIDNFLTTRNTKLSAAKLSKNYNDIRYKYSSNAFLDLHAKAYSNGEVCGSLFHCVLSEIVFQELFDDPSVFYPHIKDTIERIETYKRHPWVPLFVMAEGRDRYGTGAWTRYTETVEWNLYNKLKERIEKHATWRSYDHQKDYFKIHMKHLSDCGILAAENFPLLYKSCNGEPSDTQWKTRHLVLYSHGTMSGPIKLLRKYRIIPR